jgi:hypothetical protein
MAIYGTAFELTMNRSAAGADLHPNLCRLYRSEQPWGDNANRLSNTLDRGFVPMPATGTYPVTRQVAASSTASVGGPFALLAHARDEFAFVDGVPTTSLNGPVIRRAGYDDLFIGRGRAAGGDVVVAEDALRTALINGGAAELLTADCYAGPGYYDAVNTAIDAPYKTGINGCLWQSHLGIFDFVNDATDEDTRQDALFYAITSNASTFRTPAGAEIKNCAYASISPEGNVWILAADYGGNGIPAAVSENTADKFREHPSVFVRNVGGAVVRAVTRRWRDQISIVEEAAGSQPIGILQLANVTTQSKWLIVVDGVASVVFLQHPEGTDYRRPRDIWNNVIVPLITGTGSNVQRITTTDLSGNPVGTETRWNYLSYARYLGEPGTTVQTGTGSIG